MDKITLSIGQFLLGSITFLILVGLVKFLAKKIKNSDNRYLDINEFLPEDEIFTLRQVFYLIIMSFCLFEVFYTYTLTIHDDIFFLAIFDIAFSVFIASTFEESFIKHKLIFFLLIPFGSIYFLFFRSSVILFLDAVHVPVFLYFIKYYYEKFNEFTRHHGLGLSILLLYSIIFISFFLTQLTEHVNAIDALTMVSNAFTSNGYAVLGNSLGGKLNSIFLVWGGYIISGVTTATLTAAILMKHFNRRFHEIEKLIDEGDE